jgi:hypothetical protein
VETSKPDARPALPNPQPINTAPFKWQVFVVTKAEDGNVYVTTPESQKFDGTQAYYVITPEAYEVLARNMADILRWVKEAHWRLEYYRGEGELDDVRTVPEESQ